MAWADPAGCGEEVLNGYTKVRQLGLGFRSDLRFRWACSYGDVREQRLDWDRLVWRVRTEGNVMIAWSVGCDGEAHEVLCLVFVRREEENVGG